MHKHWKASAVTAMAAALLVVGPTANAAQMQYKYSRDNLNTSKTEKLINQKKDPKDLYKEGEVIVMYGDRNTKVNALTSSDLGNDMDVAETYSFDVDDAKAGAKSTGKETGTIHYSLVKSNTLSTAELIKQLKKRSDVKAVLPNFKLNKTTTDFKPLQWALDNQGQNNGTAGCDTNAEVTNKLIKEAASDDDKEQVIAIVDTGVDYTHPDLADKMWVNPIQDKIKGEHGYDFINYDDDPMDDNGHGSHCAGISAGNYNNEGISGIVDADNVKIMALKMLDEEGSGYMMEEVGCYNYIYRAQKLGVNVVAINNSWGVELDEEMLDWFYTEEEIAEIKSADPIFTSLAELVGENGALSCCAAGNSGINIDYNYSYPASLESDYIVSVAASDEDDDLAVFSNFGAENTDIAAPGTNILSSVCYENFEPSIYTDEQKNALCAYYDDFDSMTDEDLAKETPEGISFDWKNAKFLNNESEGCKLEISEEYGFGAVENNKSLKATFSGLKADEEYYLSVPFKAPSPEFLYNVRFKLGEGNEPNFGNMFSYGEDVCFVSVEKASFDEQQMIQEAWGGGRDSNWVSIDDSVSAKEGEDLRLVFTMVPCGDQDVSIYIDTAGISKDADSEFGKYAYYNGTSMATPAVTGAAAALAVLNPDMSALDRKDLLLGCVRKTDTAVNGTVKTNGVLDLSKVTNPAARVKSVGLSSDNANIEIKGKFLTNAEIMIDGNMVEAKESTDECITIDAKDFANKMVDLCVIKGDDCDYFHIGFATGKDMKKVGTFEEQNLMPYLNQMITDGKDTYIADNDGRVKKFNTKDGSQEVICEAFDESILGEGYESFSAGNISPLFADSNYVTLNGDIYCVATLDAGFEIRQVLAKLNKDSWEFVAEIPEAYKDRMGVSLAAYNGELYLIGGFDSEKKEFSDDMLVLDMSKGQWSDSVKLPQGRAFTKTAQVGNNMVVAMGAKDMEGTYPEVMTFDGKDWTVSKQTIDAIPDSLLVVDADDTYFEGVAAGRYKKVSLVNAKDDNEEENGEENNGEDEDMELPGVSIYDGNIGLVDGGVVLHNLFVQGMGDIVKYDLAKDAYEATGYKCSTLDVDGSKIATTVGDTLYAADIKFEGVDLYEMPVKSGLVKIDVKGEELVDMKVAKKAWLPSDTVSFTATAKKGCEITSFTVAGQKIEADKNNVYTYTGLASDNLGGIKVEITGKGAKPATPAKDDKKEDTTKPATPAKPATTEAATGTTDNTKKELPKKNQKVTVGDITYKVTKADAVNGTVSCVKGTKKKATSINVLDTVEINGYVFKVTKIEKGAFASNKNLKSITIGKNVTSIGKNVCKSCKNLKKVTIKATKLKSVGKGSFKSINKKAVIKVTKSQKKNYSKLLKKAGCKATVKVGK